MNLSIFLSESMKGVFTLLPSVILFNLLVNEEGMCYSDYILRKFINAKAVTMRCRNFKHTYWHYFCSLVSNIQRPIYDQSR